MDYLLKASAVIALFYLCFYFFLKKETFFNHNRWFLLIGVVVALLFPLVVIPIHIVVEPLLIPETVFTISENMSHSMQTARPKEKFEWQTLLSALYFIGLTVFLIQFLFQFGSLILLLLKNKKNKVGRYTYVLITSNISPFSFFKWIVYNPESFSETELQLMLTHEKVHANQMHSLDILFTQLSCAIFWFHPMIWAYRREVKQNLEYIADFKTQETTISKKTYQRLLLKTCVANHNISLSNNFYNSLIKERIVMLKKSRSKKKKQWKYLFILPLLSGLLISMNTEEIYVESQGQEPSENNITTLENAIENQHLEIVFNKKMTAKELDAIKTELQAHNITMTINQLKRNSKGEIKAINISFDTDNGSTNYTVKDTNGIDPFYFNMSDDGSFGVGTHKEKEILIVESLTNSASKNKGHNRVFSTVDSDTLEIIEIVEDSFPSHQLKGYARLHDNDSVSRKYSYTTRGAYYSKNRDSLFIQRTQNIDSTQIDDLPSRVKRAFYLDDELPFKITNQTIVILEPGIKEQTVSRLYDDLGKPLFLVNAKVVNPDAMSRIAPEQIESLTVLKGKAAIKTYGKQGENGVIIIKLKDANSSKVNKALTLKEKGSSEVGRTEVTSVSYIDDEDSSKNGTLAYITKYTSDKIIENHKSNLEKFGLNVKISKVKRNKKKEITSIKISISDEKGDKSSATYKDSDGISGIEFGKYEGALVVRTSSVN
jgi:bla regulator protein BlaR1